MNSIPEYKINDYYSSDDNIFVDIDVIQNPDTYNSPNLEVSHKHNFFAILLITDGSGFHRIDFEDFPVAKGNIFFMSPSNVHKWLDVKNLNGYSIAFNEEYFFKFQNGSSFLKDFPFMFSFCNYPYITAESIFFDELLHLTLQAKAEFDSNNLYKDEIITSIIRTILFMLMRNLNSRLCPKNLSTSEIPTRYLQLVEEYFACQKGMQFYADSLNISSGYLNSIISKNFAKSAQKVLTDRIILETKRLLSHSEMNISEIAFKLGYEDPAYFTRLFKKHTNTTPKEFRTSI